MKSTRWIPLALFLGAAVLSAWLSPALASGWRRATSIKLETYLPAGMIGSTLLHSGESLDMSIGVASGGQQIEWRLDGRIVGDQADLHIDHLSNGVHLVSLTYQDAQKQAYAATVQVQVLEEGPYAVQAAAIQAAVTLPLWEEEVQLYLPLLR